jgi:GAF domain-containing protein/nitrogen-specific signal transduction histidine kinase
MFLLATGLALWLNRGLDLRAALPHLLFFTLLGGISSWMVARASVGVYALTPSTSLVIAGLALGYEQAMIAGIAGNLLAGLVLVTTGRVLGTERRYREAVVFQVLWNGGAVTLSLLPVSGLFTSLNAASIALTFGWHELPTFLLTGMAYYVLVVAFAFVWLILSGFPLRRQWGLALHTRFFNGALPVIFAPLVALPYYVWPHLRILMLVIYLSVSMLVNTVDRMRRGLTQRLAELRVLNSIGQAFGASLELDELLTIIHDEIGKLLDVSGFYLALYDEQTNTVFSPIDYESGQPIRSSSRPYKEDGVTEYVIRTRRPLVLNHNPFAAARRLGLTPNVTREPYSYLGVPVMFGQRVLGVMALRSYGQEYAYTRHDIRLLETIAAQAGSALHNARLYEQSQRQAAELSSLNKLASLVSAGPAPEETLEAICRVVADVTRSQKAAVFLLDEDGTTARLAGGVGLSAAYRDQSTAVDARHSERTVFVRYDGPVVVEDVTTDPRFENTADLARGEGFCAIMEVPLRIGERVIGSLVAYYAAPRRFSPDEIALMETLGGQVAVAAENTRLFEEMRTRSQELEALYEASTAISASLSLKNVLQAVAISMLQALDIESCSVYLTDEGAQTLSPELRMLSSTSNGINQERMEGGGISLADLPVVTGTVRQQKPLPVQADSSTLGEGELRLAAQCQVQSGLILPLVSHGVLVGLIVAGDREAGRSFGPEGTRLAEALANQAAVTIQNARLFEYTGVELESRLKELAALEKIVQRMARRLDPDAVIEQVTRAATSATGAEFGEVALLDEQNHMLRPIFREGPPEGESDGEWPSVGGVTGRALRTGETILVGDVTRDPDYLAARDETRSELAAPIILDDHRLGVINLESTRLDAFTADHARFVANLAEHAAIAIQNARLFETIQQRADELGTLRALAVEMLSSTDTKQTLQAIAREAMKRIQAVDIHIYLYDQESDTITFGTSLWASGEVDREFSTPRPDGTTARAIHTGERVVITDPATHELTAEMWGQPGWDVPLVSVPIKRGDQILGTFNIAFEKSTAPDEDMLRFLDLLAAQAAVAIGSTQLHESERRQRQIAEWLLEASAAIASSLELGQVLLTLARHLLQISGFHVCVITEWDRETDLVYSLAEYTRAVWPPEGGPSHALDDYPVTARVLESGEPEAIYSLMPGADKAELALIARAGLTSMLMFALRAGEEVIGLAEVGSTGTVMALDEDARQRCLHVLDEAAERLVAPLPDNPRERLFELAEKLVEASGGGTCMLSAWYAPEGVIRTHVEYNNLFWPPGAGPVYKLSVHPDPSSRAADRQHMTDRGMRTMVLQPLYGRGEPVGSIELYDVTTEREVSQEELDLWRVMADQATVAIANARLADQMRADRDRSQAILDSIHDGILMFDVEGRLTMVNPRAEYLLNLHTSDYVGRHYDDMLREVSTLRGSEDMASLDEIRGVMVDARHTPTLITRRHYTLTRPVPRVIEEISLGVIGHNGEVLGRLFILRDITQERDLEAYRRDMADMLVHDLRSPLGGVISGLHMALDEFEAAPDTPDLETIQTTLEVAFASANSLLGLVEEILDVSQLEAGEMPLVIVPVNLRQLAGRALRTLEALATDADIKVHIDAPDDLPDIAVDRDQIERVFINLLDNALRHTPDDGQVRIAIEPGDVLQTVTVSDTGEGIPPEFRERIFERFFRLESDRQRGSKGSGLGLTFCRLAVEAHGGRIWVDDGPEGGAAFHFTLPTNLQPGPRQ